MALPISPLSQICKGIRNYLDSELNAPDRSKVTVLLSTPSDTASAGAGDSDHRLNLFFFRFEPSGLFPDNLPGETGWLRTFCLVTPFTGEEDNIGTGENDLRLIGEVIRVFQEKPVFSLSVDGENYHLQVIFQPLPLEQLNQLWSTQGDAVYRPSALYEISLAPIVPAVKAVQAPLAGSFNLETRATLDRAETNIAEGSQDISAMTPDLAREDWTPAIAFVHEGRYGFNYSFALGGSALAGFAPLVQVAGKAGASVDLCWETWDNVQGWQAAGAPLAATIKETTIDPEAVTATTAHAVGLPFNDHAGQMLLYAQRSYLRASDGTAVTVRSNPLLISLFAG